MTATANPGLVPSLGEARRLARYYDVVPLYAEFIGDLETPISAVLRFAEEDTVFLLESAESAERFGRYSFLGFDPKRTLSYKNGPYTGVDADGVREVPAGDPFRGLAEIVGKKSVAPLPNLPAFVGGAVGYFSYDAVRYLERLPDAPKDDLDVPEAYFAVTDTLIVFDHLRHKVLVVSLVDASPEPLVRVEGRRVMTRPVAGTRGRGGTPEEDAALAEELLADEKERAEHVMLVDLGRNDLGRVSEVGSVGLESFMEIERYSHVMHIVSTVEGDLREDLTALDALAAAFPAGTVSGAPKVRAMEIIDELESTRRGPYAGATGYYGVDGRLDTCITLRTALLKDGVAYFQAGGGVVADSVPSLEYEETRNKARAMERALEVARSREMWL